MYQESIAVDNSKPHPATNERTDIRLIQARAVIESLSEMTERSWITEEFDDAAQSELQQLEKSVKHRNQLMSDLSLGELTEGQTEELRQMLETARHQDDMLHQIFTQLKQQLGKKLVKQQKSHQSIKSYQLTAPPESNR